MKKKKLVDEILVQLEHCQLTRTAQFIIGKVDGMLKEPKHGLSPNALALLRQLKGELAQKRSEHWEPNSVRSFLAVRRYFKLSYLLGSE